MKKGLSMIEKRLVAVLMAVALAMPQAAIARVTNQTATDADIFCAGPEGAEACIDSSGNVIPTTDNDASLGTSSLRYSAAYILDVVAGDDLSVADDASVTGDLFKVMAATKTVTATGNNPKIAIDGYCGGVLRLNGGNANVTSTGFTAPDATNAGCILYVVNAGDGGGGTLTFVTNAAFIGPDSYGAGFTIVLGTNDSFIAANIGGKWVMLTSVVNNGAQ